MKFKENHGRTLPESVSNIATGTARSLTGVPYSHKIKTFFQLKRPHQKEEKRRRKLPNLKIILFFDKYAKCIRIPVTEIAKRDEISTSVFHITERIHESNKIM